MTAQPVPPRLVLYDGVCGLCHRMVRWLLVRDARGKLAYAPLQGETAARLRDMHPEIPTELDSVVYVEEGRVHLRGKAFLHVARHLGRPWRWAFHLRWLPAFVLDPLYWLIASTRYRLFGKFDTCQVPSPEHRERMLP
jgi:predicted DCC family thiol-disulfide oxidoreductase YuxK